MKDEAIDKDTSRQINVSRAFHDSVGTIQETLIFSTSLDAAPEYCDDPGEF
jgi:hypothetical protein